MEETDFKKELKKKYRATIQRYNMGQVFIEIKRDYDKKPTTKQLEEFLEEVNEVDKPHRNYATAIEITERYEVKNVFK